MARLHELFAFCFLTIAVGCCRGIDSSETPGDNERTASITVDQSAGRGSNAHDKYPDAEHHVEDLLESSMIQKILQSLAPVMKTHEQDHVSDSKDREDPFKHLRRIRSAQGRSKQKFCLLKICSFSQN